MSIRAIATTAAPAAIGPYAQGQVANGFMFTAGQIPIDPSTGELVPGGIGEQTAQVMRNLAALLAAAGRSWGDVVKTTVFLRDMQDFAVVNAIYSDAVGAARPARATVAVTGLPRDVLIEVDAIVAV